MSSLLSSRMSRLWSESQFDCQQKVTGWQHPKAIGQFGDPWRRSSHRTNQQFGTKCQGSTTSKYEMTDNSLDNWNGLRLKRTVSLFEPVWKLVVSFFYEWTPPPPSSVSWGLVDDFPDGFLGLHWNFPISRMSLLTTKHWRGYFSAPSPLLYYLSPQRNPLLSSTC